MKRDWSRGGRGGEVGGDGRDERREVRNLKVWEGQDLVDRAK